MPRSKYAIDPVTGQTVKAPKKPRKQANPDPVAPVAEVTEAQMEEPQTAIAPVTLTAAIQQVAEDATKQLAELSEQSEALASRAQSFDVTRDADLEDGVSLIRDIKATHAAIESLRKRLTGPIDHAKKTLQAIFKPRLETLEKLRDQVDAKILAYQRRVREENEARARAQQQAFAAMTFEEAMAAADACEDPEQARAIRAAAIDRQKQLCEMPAFAPPAPTASGLSVSHRWTYEVIDIRALAAAVGAGTLPSEFIELNAAAIRKAIEAGFRDIPGLRVFQAEHTVVRG